MYIITGVMWSYLRARLTTGAAVFNTNSGVSIKIEVADRFD